MKVFESRFGNLEGRVMEESTQQNVPETSVIEEETGFPVTDSFDRVGEKVAPTMSSQPSIICPNCHSTHIIISASATEKAKNRHGILYWVFIGWWLHPILWIWATIPMLIWRIIHPNRKTKTVLTTVAVCQNCGKTWVIKQ